MKNLASVSLAIVLMCGAASAQSKGLHLWPKHAELGRLLFMTAKAMIPGTVVVRCHLNEDGTVYLTSVVSGNELLGEASAENSFTWSFFVKKSRPAPFVDLTYEYRITEGGRAGATHAVIDLPHRVILTTERGWPSPK